MEDDAHHFAVNIQHDENSIIGVRGESIRTPWSICPAAEANLHRLIGKRVDMNAKSLGAEIGVGEQCTHMYDLAILLMSHIVRGTHKRCYAVSLPIDNINTPRDAVLECNGETVLRWTIVGQTIVAPVPYSGLDVRQVGSWARTNLSDPDGIEAVSVLQRAMYSSVARTMNLDTLTNAVPLAGKLGPCFVFRPEQIGNANRNVGSTIDFTIGRRPLEQRSMSTPDR